MMIILTIHSLAIIILTIMKIKLVAMNGATFEAEERSTLIMFSAGRLFVMRLTISAVVAVVPVPATLEKMLCALGNPETLLVYDVLGDVHMALYPSSSSSTTFHSSSGVDNNSNTKYGKLGRRGSSGGRFSGGGPGGYTIPLPFRGRSIFANGDGTTGGGLLIVRAPSREDYAVVAMDHLPVEPQEVDDEEGDDEDAQMGYDGTMADQSQRQQRRRRRRSSTQTTPTGLSLPATPRSSLTRQQRRRCDTTSTDDGDVDADHLSLEDPPVPMRYLERRGMRFVDSGYMVQQHMLCWGVAVVDTTTESTMIDGGGGVPCLFSLRHPLDEIHPLAVVVGGTTTKLEVGNVNNDNLSLFTNAMETLVFVGSPRLFHGTLPYHATTTASPICVTYNERRNRHTFWSLSDAVSHGNIAIVEGNWKGHVASDVSGRSRNSGI